MGKYVLVIGAVNVDIWGRSYKTPVPKDSNPGECTVSLGGVGRNVAHNLRLLGVEVQLLTALGQDGWAARIRENCASLGIGLDGALTVPGGRSSTYLYITGPDGDLVLAVCDAYVAEQLTPSVMEARMDLLEGAELVVIDGNLTEETLDCLTSRCTRPLFADPVSVPKAGRLLPVLSKIHTLKPNAAEAAVLTGETDPIQAVKVLRDMGVKQVFLSDGSRGLVCAGEGTDVFRVPCPSTQPVNTTGGGDAVLAALCRCHLDGRDLRSAARYALQAGAIAVACAGAVNPALSHETLLQAVQY